MSYYSTIFSFNLFKMKKCNPAIKIIFSCFAVILICYNTTNAQFLNKDATWVVHESGVI